MADSTKTVIVKESDGSVVPGTFFADNAALMRLAIKLTGITEIAWSPEKRGLVITTDEDGDLYVPCYQVPD